MVLTGCVLTRKLNKVTEVDPDRFLYELSCKNSLSHTHGHTHTHTHTDSNEYSIVAFSKNATIISQKVWSESVGV